MKRLIPGLSLVAGILVIGLGLSWLAAQELVPNPVFSATYQVDLARLASRLGILPGLLVLGGFCAIWIVQHQYEQK